MADKGDVAMAQRYSGWFYWYCFPGCLPDSEPIGPFDTEADALADARSNSDTE
jgi:hypothetical protein